MSLSLVIALLGAVIKYGPSVYTAVKPILTVINEHVQAHGPAAATTPLKAEHQAIVEANTPDWFDSSAYEN